MMPERYKPDPARSAQMALVKSRDTKPEIRVRKALWTAGLRYRLHVPGLPGKPDVVFPGRKLAIFVHGCFWHRHPGCARTRIPKTRQEFWEHKFAGNVERDQRKIAGLEELGWKVLVIWECETENAAQLAALVEAVRAHPSKSLPTPKP